MNLYNIFPTPYWISTSNKTKTDLEITKKALDWSFNLKNTSKSASISNRGGFQSIAFNDFTIFPFLDYIKSRLNNIPSFNFSNWWININNTGDFNFGHTHPNSDLSLIWYLTPNYNSLVLTNPQDHIRYKLYNLLNYPLLISENCDAGDIVVFPSDINHYVEPHEKETSRVSVAMNLILN